MIIKPKVYIDQPIPTVVQDYLSTHCDLFFRQPERPIGSIEEKNVLSEIDGIFVYNRKINAEFIENAPKLRVVSTMSVGYNHFDLDVMRARRIIGTHTPYVLDETVADLVFALILGTARRVAELDRYVREGNWKKSDNEVLFGIDVHHAKLGIIGFGRIGEAIARRAKYGFQMEVAYHTRTRKVDAESTLGVRYESMDELLATSDFVVLMTPLTPATTRLMGREQFAKMKSSAIFINASRGQTVDEQAMVEALEQGRIRAAGLDVFEQEPIPQGHPLLSMRNVTLLPHIGSATAQTRLDMAMLAARNLVNALYENGSMHVVPELK
jgi:gluconate 2-dehydrogenase